MTNTPTQHRKVLIVEDDLEMCMVLDRVLTTTDQHVMVDWATSVDEAISRLQEKAAQSITRPYDLILADIFLEGQSTGIDLWKLCQEEFPDVPVVVTSSLPLEKFFALVGRGNIAPPFLAKPFQVGGCRQFLEGILSYGKAS